MPITRDPRLKAAALGWALYGVAIDKDRLAPERTIGEALDQVLALAGEG